MACIFRFTQSVNEKGVDPLGFEKFVEYTINASNPSNDKVGSTFANTLYLTTSDVITLMLFFVWFIFTMITIILFRSGVLDAITSFVIIMAFPVCVTIYAILATLYEKHFAYSIMPEFQSSLIETVIYTSNSIFRDALYDSYCR